MCHRAFSVVLGLCLALGLAAASPASLAAPALAQNTDAKPADQAPANGQEPAKEPQKVDEFAEAQKALGGPAGSPECVWLGRRGQPVWHDDLIPPSAISTFTTVSAPERPYPGNFPLPAPAFQQYRSEGRRQPQRPGEFLLDQSQFAGGRAGGPAAPAASVPSPTTNR